MKLTCGETGDVIKYDEADERLIAGSRDDDNLPSALSREAIHKIPECAQRRRRLGQDEKGIDIWEAELTKNHDEEPRVRIKRFLFSVSEETARKYLPKYYGTHPVTQETAKSRVHS